MFAERHSDIAGKTEFVTGKKFKHASLVYHNKRLKCFNVVSEIFFSQLNIFCLIQGIYKLYTNKYILELYSTNSGK